MPVRPAPSIPNGRPRTLTVRSANSWTNALRRAKSDARTEPACCDRLQRRHQEGQEAGRACQDTADAAKLPNRSKRRRNAEAAGALSACVLLFPHSQLDRQEFRLHIRRMGSLFLPNSIQQLAVHPLRVACGTTKWHPVEQTQAWNRWCLCPVHLQLRADRCPNTLLHRHLKQMQFG